MAAVSPLTKAGMMRSLAPLSLPPVAEAADSLAEEEPEVVDEPVSEASESLAVEDAVGEVLLPDETAEKAEVVLLDEGYAEAELQ
jgi:hypothetical protein